MQAQSSEDSSEGLSLSAPQLSPIQVRLSEVLSNIQSDDPKLGVIMRAFAKHLRKNPLDDSAIEEFCSFLTGIATYVRDGAGDVPVTALPAPEVDEHVDAAMTDLAEAIAD